MNNSTAGIENFDKIDLNAVPEGYDATEISGRVQKLFCGKPTFSAGVIQIKSNTDGEKFSVKGFVKVGEFVTLKGAYVNDPKWGWQFVGKDVVPTIPTNVDGLRLWLWWNGNNIGTVRANKLVEAYGESLIDRLIHEPEVVAATIGIKLQDVEVLAERWKTKFNTVAAETELAAMGLTRHQVELIVGKWKGSAVTVIKEDPYLLLGEIDGMGWATVDEIAKKIGISQEDPKRIRAAITSVVREAVRDGHTCLPTREVYDSAAERLESKSRTLKIDPAVLLAAEQEAEKLGHLKVISGDGFRYLAASQPYHYEKFLWNYFKANNVPNPHIDFETADKVAAMYATISLGKGRTATLDEGQLAAVYTAAASKVCCITGGAGAGKTLVARAIAKMFIDADVDVTFLAPTGKAARRLEEVTGKSASTIHRALGLGRNFTSERTLPPGVVIIDEFSMVDIQLAFHVMNSAGPETSLVFIGDDNQLSPVGPGAVLRDILANDLVPVARLRGCHRQAGTLKQNCSHVLEGRIEPSAMDETPAPWMVHQRIDTKEKLTSAVEALFTKYLPEWGIDPLAGTQFLTSMHKGPWGTKYLNKLLQYLNQKKNGLTLPKPSPTDESRPSLIIGDKVIQTENNYKLGVMNGHQGIVDCESPLIVAYENGPGVEYSNEEAGQVELGYCITPHKAQGSEWPCAVVVCPKAHGFMQHRNWLYTAVTRAQKIAIIIGDEYGIKRAGERIETSRRQTLLSVFAAHKEARPA